MKEKNFFKKKLRLSLWSIIILIIISFFIGKGFKREKQAFQNNIDIHSLNTKKKDNVWTCSMHPQIKMSKKGKCAICFMDLIPLDLSQAEINNRTLLMTETAKKLAEIEVEPVVRKSVFKKIRVSGKISYDETRIKTISSWISGRLEKLFIDYTGIPVKKGDRMAIFYSPELLSAQEELLTIYKNSLANKKQSYYSLSLSAVEEKLRLWGLADYQIEEIKKKGIPANFINIYAPLSGIVIHKNAKEGMYLKTGTSIFTIADFSRLWLKLDIYEKDIVFIKYGQKVEFSVESFPGEKFIGQISFIEPFLTKNSRTLKIRVNVDNKSGKLKPEMFAKAFVNVEIGQNNKILNSELAGKWISPKHPEIVKDKFGKCDICNVPLVSTESLGYAEKVSNKDLPLVIPHTAPLITGKRAVVYIKKQNTKKLLYEGKNIELGHRVGDYYIVNSGLKEGEEVVVKGNFKIDSALQILAKTSMMNPEKENETKSNNNYFKDINILKTITKYKFKNQFTKVFYEYNHFFKLS